MSLVLMYPSSVTAITFSPSTRGSCQAAAPVPCDRGQPEAAGRPGSEHTAEATVSQYKS